MTDLIEFLRARLDEDEAAARAAGAKHWTWDHGFGAMCNEKDCPYGHLVADGDVPTLLMEVHGFDIHQPWQGAEHIARWDPARVLAEVAAKRAALLTRGQGVCSCDEYEEPPTDGDTREPIPHHYDCAAYEAARFFVQVYADHADFDPAWAA